MAFPKQPVVNVKTSDTTGYIIEFLTQSTMGPGGCVRVTTRDVMKLSAVSQTTSEIVPQTQPTNSFGSGPEVVVISPTKCNESVAKSAFNKQSSFKFDSDKPPVTKQPSKSSTSVETVCVTMEDAACCTDTVCTESASSQTDLVKLCEKACSMDERESEQSPEVKKSDANLMKVCVIKFDEKKGSKSTQCSENKDAVNGQRVFEIKRCCCPKIKSDEDARSKNDRTTETDTSRTCQKNSQTDDEMKKDEREPICKVCRSKTKRERSTQSNTSLMKDKGCETEKETKKEDKPNVCRICFKGKDGDHYECVDEAELITDIYKNIYFDETKMNRMPVEVDISQTMICTGCNVRNSVSLMNIDINDSCMNSSSESTSSSLSCIADDASSSSQSICAICRAAEKARRCCKRQTDKTKMQSTEDDLNGQKHTEKRSKRKSSEKKQKKGRRKSKVCRYCLSGEPAESEMSVKECGTSSNKITDSSDATQTKVICLKDECVQCLSVQYKNASVDTDEQISCSENCCCMTQTDPEEEQPSITKSIKDFVARYVWGDPNTSDSSTQCGETSFSEQGRCFVWCLKNGVLTPMETDYQSTEKPNPKLKDSSTQMDVDESVHVQIKICRNDNQNDQTRELKSKSSTSMTQEEGPCDKKPKNILIKRSESDLNNSRTNLSNKRSVVFNTKPEILERNVQNDETITIMENRKTVENVEDRLIDIDLYTPTTNEDNENSKKDPKVSLEEDEDDDVKLIESRELPSNQSLTMLNTMYFGSDESFNAIENGLVMEGTLLSEPQKDSQETCESESNGSLKNDKLDKGKSTKN